jgi:hypothetical protein
MLISKQNSSTVQYEQTRLPNNQVFIREVDPSKILRPDLNTFKCKPCIRPPMASEIRTIDYTINNYYEGVTEEEVNLLIDQFAKQLSLRIEKRK